LSSKEKQEESRQSFCPATTKKLKIGGRNIPGSAPERAGVDKQYLIL